MFNEFWPITLIFGAIGAWKLWEAWKASKSGSKQQNPDGTTEFSDENVSIASLPQFWVGLLCAFVAFAFAVA